MGHGTIKAHSESGMESNDATDAVSGRRIPTRFDGEKELSDGRKDSGN